MTLSKYLSVINAIILIAFFSCNNPFPDFTQKDNGVYMKLLSFEESENKFKPNRYVSADIKIINGKDLVYRQYREEVKPPKHQLAFIYEYLNQGDSAAFKIPKRFLKNQFPELTLDRGEDEYITVYIKVYKYLTHLNYKIDAEMLEQMILNRFLKENNITHHKRGVYIKKILNGKSKRVSKGKDVTIQYIGKFLNQLEFDNTYKQSALTFTFGNPGQVIKGLEIALKGMREGEKSKIIIPSQLAFGDEGSSTQVIPPFTSVIYELEIVKIN